MSSAEIKVFTAEEWQQQMFAEVKVAYRLIETVGSADVDAVPYDPDFTARVDAEYDHWLAEVERAAAEKALTDAVDDWESGTVEHDEIKHTSDAPLGWGDGSVVDAVMASGPVMTWLRKRAAVYRREETE